MTQPEVEPDRCEHICHFFRTFEEQRAAVMPFFQQGFENGEHCIYVTAEQSPDFWYQEFDAYSAVTKDALERGALVVLEKSAWRPDEAFATLPKAREAIEMFSSLLRDYPAVRIAGDASWALNPELPVEQLCHWEATASLIYEGQDLQAICQYNLAQHSAPHLHTALRTHPLVIVDGRLLQNPFFEGPQILEDEPASFHSDATFEMVEDMLNKLRSLS